MVLAHLPAAAPCSQLRCRRFLALARCKLYWMAPVWGRSAQEVPVETQLLLFELEVGELVPACPLRPCCACLCAEFKASQRLPPA